MGKFKKPKNINDSSNFKRNIEIKNNIEIHEETLQDKKLIYEWFKRFFDVTLSLLALLFLSPIMIIVSLLIVIESKCNPIFCQKRVGKNNKVFVLYKFKSMVENAEELQEELLYKNEMDGPMFKMKDDPRVTKVGRYIRRTNIDELPQLINIIKGEMSIVGPRPSLPKEVEKFEPWMMKRLCIKPGLTCYWQVLGKNSLSFEEWMNLDLKYVADRNLLLDIVLILRTLKFFKGHPNEQ